MNTCTMYSVYCIRVHTIYTCTIYIFVQCLLLYFILYNVHKNGIRRRTSQAYSTVCTIVQYHIFRGRQSAQGGASKGAAKFSDVMQKI